MTIIDKRDGTLDALLGGLDIEVTVGIHESEGNENHDGPTNAEVGSYHEFGSRSFIRGYFDESAADVARFIDEAAARVLDGEDPVTAGEIMALQLESGVKERILAGIDPPLAESTRKRRGDDAVPLVNTSQMLGAIRGKAKLT